MSCLLQFKKWFPLFASSRIYSYTVTSLRLNDDWAGSSIIEEAWLVHNTEAQCTLKGRQEAKGQRVSFMFKFFLSCLKSMNF